MVDFPRCPRCKQQLCEDEAPLGVCGYCYEAGDEFTLGVDPLPRPKPATFDNAKATQRQLLDGLDLLPGQQDLF